MTAPLVTIVIPTFNRSAMLRRCIESALAQTQPCSIIVVDHGSADDTPAVAASFGDRIRYLRREVDHGVHFCWLDGVINTQTEFIHLNFDDDFMRPQFVEKCMALMGPDVAFTMSAAEVRDESTGAALCQLFATLGPTGVHPVCRYMRTQISGLVSPGAIILRKKDILDQLYIGGVPFARHEYRGVGPDWLMSAMATLRYPKFGFVAETLVIFSAHEGSITIDALKDAARKRALHRAYEQSRIFYVMTLLVRRLRLDLAAICFLKILQLGAWLTSAFSRPFQPKPPTSVND